MEAKESTGTRRIGRDADTDTEMEKQQDALADEKEDDDDDETRFDTTNPRRSLSAIDRQYASPPSELPRRIHIIGTGSIGKLVAHSLRGIANPPPITLIFHRYRLLEAWEKSRKEITIQDDEFKVSRSGYEVELLPDVRRVHGVEVREGEAGPYEYEGMRPDEAAKALKERREAEERAQKAGVEGEETEGRNEGEEQGDGKEGRTKEEAAARGPVRYHARPGKNEQYHSSEPIDNLIVTTKASLTIPALADIRHRLTPKSSICFLQNGMGVIDDVNKHLFPDEAKRPTYIQGIITHGVNVPPEVAQRDPFYAVHAGHGTIALGILPRAGTRQPDFATPQPGDEGKQDYKQDIWAPSARYLLRTLTRTPVLCAVGFTPTELLQQQLEKLAVNSILNPLTSLLDHRNGALLYNFALTRTMRLMLAETSLVIRSLPELQSIPNINTRFSADRLEKLVVSVADKTANNISSMLADVRAGRKTEIEYINGYVVRRGEEVGVKCVVNYAIMQSVIGKAMITQRESQEEVPVGRGLNREP